ncbi:hypothetical protein THAOC_00818, partial [Thalassiosira oceanica]
MVRPAESVDSSAMAVVGWPKLAAKGLRTLQNDRLVELWLCRPDLAAECGDYELGSSRELEWLGHFAKKSTRLESVGIYGDAFVNCSGHSVDRFRDNLGKCNHIKKMSFFGADLAEIIDKLDGAMKSNNFTHFVVKECHLGVPEATLLFNTFGDMNSLEELCIDCEEDFANLNDGDMAGCIPSLAACTGMRSLKLNYLNLSTNSCAALRGVLPRMATLRKLILCGNSLDDDCTRLLAQGLSDCKQIQLLDLTNNRISDNGLDVLIQRLPTSVDALYMAWNDITLARHVLLLRLRVLNIWGNTLCPGGTGVIAASLANPECHLESLIVYQCNIGDEGTATLADGLRHNQRLTDMSLGHNNITERGWNAFSSILCDASSINATYNSNHTLESLGYNGAQIPQDVKMMLDLNQGNDKSRVAASKILQAHRHLDMRPLFGRELGLLPYVIAWLDLFAKSRPDLKLSSIFEFVRAMPMKATDGVVGNVKGGETQAQQLVAFTCRDGHSQSWVRVNILGQMVHNRDVHANSFVRIPIPRPGCDESASVGTPCGSAPPERLAALARGIQQRLGHRRRARASDGVTGPQIAGVGLDSAWQLAHGYVTSFLTSRLLLSSLGTPARPGSRPCLYGDGIQGQSSTIPYPNGPTSGRSESKFVLGKPPPRALSISGGLRSPPMHPFCAPAARAVLPARP